MPQPFSRDSDLIDLGTLSQSSSGYGVDTTDVQWDWISPKNHTGPNRGKLHRTQLCHRMGHPGVRAGAREAARTEVRDPQDSARWTETQRTFLCKRHKCFHAGVIQNRVQNSPETKRCLREDARRTEDPVNARTPSSGQKYPHLCIGHALWCDCSQNFCPRAPSDCLGYTLNITSERTSRVMTCPISVFILCLKLMAGSVCVAGEIVSFESDDVSIAHCFPAFRTVSDTGGMQYMFADFYWMKDLNSIFLVSLERIEEQNSKQRLCCKWQAHQQLLEVRAEAVASAKVDIDQELSPLYRFCFESFTPMLWGKFSY